MDNIVGHSLGARYPVCYASRYQRLCNMMWQDYHPYFPATYTLLANKSGVYTIIFHTLGNTADFVLVKAVGVAWFGTETPVASIASVEDGNPMTVEAEPVERMPVDLQHIGVVM